MIDAKYKLEPYNLCCNFNILPFNGQEKCDDKRTFFDFSKSFSLKENLISLFDLCQPICTQKDDNKEDPYSDFEKEFGPSFSEYASKTKVRWNGFYNNVNFISRRFMLSCFKVFTAYENFIVDLTSKKHLDFIVVPQTIQEAYDEFIHCYNNTKEECFSIKVNIPNSFLSEMMENQYISSDSIFSMAASDFSSTTETRKKITTPFTLFDLKNILCDDYVANKISFFVISSSNCYKHFGINSDNLKALTNEVVKIFGSYTDPKVDITNRKEFYILYSMYYNVLLSYFKLWAYIIDEIKETYDFAYSFYNIIKDNDLDFNDVKIGEGEITLKDIECVCPVSFKSIKLMKTLSEFKMKKLGFEEISLEAGEGDMFAATDASLQPKQMSQISVDKINENYKRKRLQLQKTFTDIFKVKFSKIKNKIDSIFFKRWYGRIPSMFQRYGNTAKITENRMKGDPSQILMSSGLQYIQNMMQNTEKLFQEILDTAKRIASSGGLPQKLNVARAFCKQYPIEVGSDPKTLEKQIVNEATFRIASCIFQDNGIYGYTPEGIVENGKFPTCNHIVTSLFIDNAHEQAEELTVSDIFQQPQSLMMFAHPEQFQKFEQTYNQSVQSVVRNFNPKMCAVIHKNLDLNYKRFSSAINRPLGADTGITGDRDDVSNMKKQAKAIDDGIIKAMDLIIDQKRRCIQCVGAMYEMTSRVIGLAKRCVASLHQEEMKRGDVNFNSGMRSIGLNATTARLNKVNQKNNTPSVVTKTATGRFSWY